MDYQQARFNMVEQQIRPWDVLDFKLLDILSEIPREEFVSEDQRSYAYADMHLSLPNHSTMLEPKLVARLIQALDIQETEKALEIGTGAGYATAILSCLAKSVTTIDVDAEQLARAQQVLERLGYRNIHYKAQDGFDDATLGEERFNAIYIGAAVSQIPVNVRAHLAVGGKMVVVAGSAPVQRALLITREADDTFTQKVLFDTFIPSLIQGSQSLGHQPFVF